MNARCRDKLGPRRQARKLPNGRWQIRYTAALAIQVKRRASEVLDLSDYEATIERLAGRE